MSITKQLVGGATRGNANVLSQAVTAEQNDLLIFCVTWRKSGSGDFLSLTWGTENFFELTLDNDVPSVIDARDHRTRYFGLIVQTAGTHNVVGASQSYIQTNYAYAQLRSTTKSFNLSSIRRGQIYGSDTEAYTQPVFPIVVNEGECVLDFLSWLGWSVGYADVTTTTAVPVGGLTSETTITSTTMPTGCGRLYVGYSNTVGSYNAGWNRSGAGAPMYNHASFIIGEAAYLVTALSPLRVGGVIDGEVSGFDDGEATFEISGHDVNGVETVFFSVDVTVEDDAIEGVLNDFIEGNKYPLLPALDLHIGVIQGAKKANFIAHLDLPADHEVLRDENNLPTTFDAIESEDPTYAGFPFEEADVPLTEEDTVIWSTLLGAIIYRDSRIDIPKSSTPTTLTLKVWRGATGIITFHDFIMLADSGLVADLTLSSVDQLVRLINLNNEIELPESSLVFGTPTVHTGEKMGNTDLVVTASGSSGYIGNVTVNYKRLNLDGLLVYGEGILTVGENATIETVLDALNGVFGCNIGLVDIDVEVSIPEIDYEGVDIVIEANPTSLVWLDSIPLVLKLATTPLSEIIAITEMDGLEFPEM